GNVAPASAGTTVTILATAPTTPFNLILLSASDSGTFNNDAVTNFNNTVVSPSNAPVFQVSGIAPNNLVRLLRNGLVVSTLTSAAGGTVQIADNNGGNGTIPDGTYNYTVQQIDLAGNAGPVIGTAATVVINAALPATSPVRLDANSDTGASN